MTSLYIEGDKSTPEINFNQETNMLSISGESYPENALSFYQPVFDWLNNYLVTKPSFTFIFKLNYFNTSSSKVILDIIEILEKYYKEGNDITLEWHFHVDDEDMQDSGLEFTEDLTLKCKFIKYE